MCRSRGIPDLIHIKNESHLGMDGTRGDGGGVRGKPNQRGAHALGPAGRRSVGLHGGLYPRKPGTWNPPQEYPSIQG